MWKGVRTHMGARGASQHAKKGNGAAKTLVGVLASVAIIAASFFGAYSFAAYNRANNDAAAASNATSGEASQNSTARDATETNGAAGNAASRAADNGNASSNTTSTAAVESLPSSVDANSSIQSGQASGASSSLSSESTAAQESSAPGEVVKKYGIDVSELQGAIDWNAVAADGIEFAFIRVGYRGIEKGELHEDETYKTNLKEAKAAGIERGAYFYSQALNEKEAEDEAGFVLKALDGDKLEYPVVFDYEVVSSGLPTRVGGINSDEATKIARAFCSTIEKAGYDVMIYGNTYDLAHFHLEDLADWPIWYAEYNEAPAYVEEFVIWQYSCTGIVEGIGVDVDLNLDMRTVEGSKAHATATRDPNELPELFRTAENAS